MLGEDLFEHPQPLAAYRVLKIDEAGDIARLRKACDNTAPTGFSIILRVGSHQHAKPSNSVRARRKGPRGCSAAAIECTPCRQQISQMLALSERHPKNFNPPSGRVFPEFARQSRPRVRYTATTDGG
jgi:hypothetical protein